MEIRKAQIIRQLPALLAVVCALFVLFEREWFSIALSRVFSEFSSGGFQVEYYELDEPERVIFRRSERYLVKNYGGRAVTFLGPSKRFGARWTGVLTVPESTEYDFFFQVIGGAKVYIDDQLEIDHWESPGWSQGKYVKVFIPKGRRKIRVEYVTRSDEAALRLKWKGGGVPANTVLGVPYVQKK